MQPNACAVRKVKDDMTGKAEDEGSEPRPLQRGPPRGPNPLDVIYPALQVGGLSGMSGLLVGAYAGIARSSTPALFALASGVQWFALGSTFTASRGFFRQSWAQDKITPKDSIQISALSGAVAGTAGGLLRGPRNVLPATILFAALGAGGQALYNRADDQVLKPAEPAHQSKMDAFLNSKWSPMRPLSSSEYENMMRERLLKVNADISIIDDNIVALRAREEAMKKENSSEAGSNR